MKEIVIEVRCVGCNELIAKPIECDMRLFRIGIYVHNACAELFTYCKVDECMNIVYGDIYCPWHADVWATR